MKEKLVFPSREGLTAEECLNFTKLSITKKIDTQKNIELFYCKEITEEQYSNLFEELIKKANNCNINLMLEFLISKFNNETIIKIYFKNYYIYTEKILLLFHNMFDEYINNSEYEVLLKSILKIAVESMRYKLVKTIMESIDLYNQESFYIEEELIDIAINNKDNISLQYLVLIPVNAETFHKVMLVCIENNWLNTCKNMKCYKEDQYYTYLEELYYKLIDYNRIKFIKKIIKKNDFLSIKFIKNIDNIINYCYDNKRYDMLRELNRTFRLNLIV